MKKPIVMLLALAVAGMAAEALADTVTYYASPTGGASATCSDTDPGTPKRVFELANAVDAGDECEVVFLDGTYNLTPATWADALGYVTISRQMTIHSESNDPRLCTLDGGGSAQSLFMFNITAKKSANPVEIRGINFTHFEIPITEGVDGHVNKVQTDTLLTLADCWFVQNMTTYSRGCAFWYSNNNGSEMVMHRCSIVSNGLQWAGNDIPLYTTQISIAARYVYNSLFLHNNFSSFMSYGYNCVFAGNKSNASWNNSISPSANYNSVFLDNYNSSGSGDYANGCLHAYLSGTFYGSLPVYSNCVVRGYMLARDEPSVWRVPEASNLGYSNSYVTFKAADSSSLMPWGYEIDHENPGSIATLDVGLDYAGLRDPYEQEITHPMEAAPDPDLAACRRYNGHPDLGVNEFAPKRYGDGSAITVR